MDNVFSEPLSTHQVHGRGMVTEGITAALSSKRFLVITVFQS